jgi:hypothetical protein
MSEFDRFVASVFGYSVDDTEIYFMVFGHNKTDLVTLVLRKALVKAAMEVTLEGSQDYKLFCAYTVLKFLKDN